jgi:hypothetical protein
MGRPAIDLTGRRFGLLTVLRRDDLAPSGAGVHARWFVRCDCGTEKAVSGGTLNRGASHSCGCKRTELQSAKVRTHGKSKTPTWWCWSAMNARCTDERHRSYKRYGGRGIRVCQRWSKSFEAFLADMGERPDGLSIDRKDNDGLYSCGKCEECIANGWPANCRWATTMQQGRNRSTTKLLSYGETTATTREWSEILGISIHVLRHRLAKGHSIADIAGGVA